MACVAACCLSFGSSPSLRLSLPPSTFSRSPSPTRPPFLVLSKAQSDPANAVGATGIAATAAGVLANPIVAWSLFTLKTTGCGLPPGPGGVIGALEGVSYLALLGIISWSLYTKVKTGAGLPSGPFGLLGAVEGLSYLSVLAIVVVFGLQFLDYGYIPGPLPGEQCFG